MNTSLLQLLGKYITVATISLMSTFNIGNYNESNIEANNELLSKDGAIVNSISYKTVVEYSDKIPSNITNVIQEGSVGLSIKEETKPTTASTDNNTQEQTPVETVKVVQEATNEIIQKGTGAYGIYTGKLVGYGPDCQGCSGEGYLACRTESNARFSLKYDGIYYTDDEFGKVRILAANKKFPCGTIIQVEKQDGTKFLAVVMDRVATTMENGELMDLAYASQSDKTVFAVDGLLGNNITFSVQRWGW